MKIKKEESELKPFKSELADFEEVKDLRTVEADFIVKKLEEKIKLMKNQ